MLKARMGALVALTILVPATLQLPVPTWLVSDAVRLARSIGPLSVTSTSPPTRPAGS